MNIRIRTTIGVWVEGVNCPAGAVLDLDKDVANGLINMNRAEHAKGEKVSTKADLDKLRQEQAARRQSRFETATAPPAETTDDA